MRFLSIIIPSYKRQEILHQTLTSLKIALSNIKEEYEVIIVNDDKSQSIDVRVKINNLIVFNNPKQGAGSARNYGAKNASGKYLFFLDNDMILLPNSLSKLLAIAPNYKMTCFNLNWVFNPKIPLNIKNSLFYKYLEKFNFTTLKGWYGCTDNWHEKELIQVDSLTSQVLLIEKELFELIGGYDEDIPYAGFEDYLFSKKLRQNNVKMYVYTPVLAYHNEIDNLNITSWLERKKRGGITRAFAVKKGNTELIIKKNKFVHFIYLLAISLKLKNLFFLLLRLLEIAKIDFLYFKFVNLLLGLYHYEGYIQGLKKNFKV